MSQNCLPIVFVQGMALDTVSEVQGNHLPGRLGLIRQSPCSGVTDSWNDKHLARKNQAAFGKTVGK